MRTFKHSVANYPDSFLGIVVRPHNMCIQFRGVTSKLRVAHFDESDLVKCLNNIKVLPLSTEGIKIDISGMGTPIPLIEELQEGLIEAYLKYYKENEKYYRKTYNKDFLSFLLRQRASLTRVITVIERMELEREMYNDEDQN